MKCKATTKVCSICKNDFVLSAFYRSSTSPDGRAYACKECDSKRRHQNYLKNKNKQLAKQRESRKPGTPGHAVYLEYLRQWRMKPENKERVFFSHIQRCYGMSKEEYMSLLWQQNDSCAICAIHRNDLSYRLHVDHHHESGKVRGLLCSKCNTAVGQLDENLDRFKAAILYLSTPIL